MTRIKITRQGKIESVLHLDGYESRCATNETTLYKYICSCTFHKELQEDDFCIDHFKIDQAIQKYSEVYPVFSCERTALNIIEHLRIVAKNAIAISFRIQPEEDPLDVSYTEVFWEK